MRTAYKGIKFIVPGKTSWGSNYTITLYNKATGVLYTATLPVPLVLTGYDGIFTSTATAAMQAGVYALQVFKDDKSEMLEYIEQYVEVVETGIVVSQ